MGRGSSPSAASATGSTPRRLERSAKLRRIRKRIQIRLEDDDVASIDGMNVEIARGSEDLDAVPGIRRET